MRIRLSLDVTAEVRCSRPHLQAALELQPAVPAHQLTSAPLHHPAAQLAVRPTHPRFLRFLPLLPALQANFQAMGAPEAAWRQKSEDHYLEPPAQSSMSALCRSLVVYLRLK